MQINSKGKDITMAVSCVNTSVSVIVNYHVSEASFYVISNDF